MHTQMEAFASLFTKPRIVLLAWLHLLTLDLYQAKYVHPLVDLSHFFSLYFLSLIFAFSPSPVGCPP